MRKTLLLLLLGSAVPMLLAGGGPARAPSLLERLSADEATAREALRRCVEQGEDAIPALRELLKQEDPRVRGRARNALGRITGQWGGEGGILWKRSMKEAAGGDRPLLVLHLFGKLDEEFC